MNVLVTGGTGFVGRRLVARLLARGDDVTVLSRDPERKTPRLRATRILAWNPAAGLPPIDALAMADAVVNLLGESISKGRWTDVKKQRIRDSRIAGTRNLVAGIAAASPRPRVLVSGSAVGYYGPRGDEPLDEDSPPGSDFLATLARDWEMEARRADGAGVRVVCLRTGVVLGREGGALRAMLLPFQLGLGGPSGSGRQWMSWVHIDDVCGLIVHALDRQAVQGPMNVTAPDTVRNADFAKTLGRVLGRPAILPAPAFALRLLLGEMADVLLLSGQKVLPKKAEGTSYRFQHPDLEEALEEILNKR